MDVGGDRERSYLGQQRLGLGRSNIELGAISVEASPSESMIRVFYGNFKLNQQQWMSFRGGLLGRWPRRLGGVGNKVGSEGCTRRNIRPGVGCRCRIVARCVAEAMLYTYIVVGG